MAGPWERYAAPASVSSEQESGPWAKYQQAAPAAEAAPQASVAKPAGLSMTTDINGDPLPQRTVSFLHGVMDPVAAASQLIDKALPTGAIASATNWLSDKTGGILPRAPEGGFDNAINQREQAYEQGRAANGETGIDGYRALGNILSPANLAMAARVPQAITLAGRIGLGAASGAASGALTPVASDDFWGDKAKQVGIGAGVGGAVPVAVGAISRLISPNASVNPNVQLLKDEGITPTIGQTLGGWANRTEEKLQSLPLVGDMISRARSTARDEFNTAAINRATAPIGAKVTGSGQEAVKQAGDTLSDAYNSALSQVQHVPLDQQFHGQLSQLQQMSQGLVPNMSDKFNKTLNDVVLGRVGPQGSMLGSTYKDVDSELGKIASRYGKSQMASEQEYGDAVKQLQSLLNQQMRRTNPNVAQQLQGIDEGWANLVRVEGAAKAAHNAEGVFTPAQLNAAIRGADDSVRGRAVSRGTALMQDLGSAGQQVLGNKVPNSGTADRMWAGAGALASGAISPLIPAALLAGGAAYTRPVQALLGAAVSARPAIAQPTAEALRQLSPSAAPLLAPAMVGVQTDRKGKQKAFADGGIIGDDGLTDEQRSSLAYAGKSNGSAAGSAASAITGAIGSLLGAGAPTDNAPTDATNTSTVRSIMGDSEGIDAGSITRSIMGDSAGIAADSTVRGLLSESAFGSSKSMRSFKNGGMIGAPEMSGAIRALAFGRSRGG